MIGKTARMFLALGIPGLLLPAAAAVSQAQELMSMAAGAKIQRVATIGNKQVPLPDGEWEVAYTETSRPHSLDVGSALLVRKSGGKGVGFILIRTNLQPGSGRGFNRPRLCDRDDLHHNGSDNHYNKENADCWVVGHFVAGNRVFPAVRRLRDHVRKIAGTSTLLNNWYRRNDSVDFLQVSHYINPTAYGFPAERERSWIQSAWHANAVGGESERQRFVDAVKRFGEKYGDAVRKGFKNRLGSGVSGLKFSFKR